MSIEYVNPPELNDEESQGFEPFCRRPNREIGRRAIVYRGMPGLFRFLDRIISGPNPWDDEQWDGTPEHADRLAKYNQEHSMVPADSDTTISRPF